jgi:hypothetical protein
VLAWLLVVVVGVFIASLASERAVAPFECGYSGVIFRSVDIGLLGFEVRTSHGMVATF